MELSSDVIQFINENNCRFISLKFLGENGILNQIDLSVNNIPMLKIILNQKNIDLKPIKCFLDPFRSAPTTNIFCIKPAINFIRDAIIEFENIDDLTAEISFWVLGDDMLDKTNLLLADPIDLNANLRAEIIQCLENIGILTTFHYHGSTKNESVIGIRGKTLLNLADNMIITNYIIDNCAASYGKKVLFNISKKANLNLLVLYSSKVSNDFYSKLITRINKVCSYYTNISQYKFEILKHNDYPYQDGLLFNIEYNKNFIIYNLFKNL